MSGKTPTGGRTTVGKKIPLVTVAAPEEAARLAGLPLEATVAMADVAGAIRDGLMAFASATGLVVMYDLMVAELTERIGPKHARTTALLQQIPGQPPVAGFEERSVTGLPSVGGSAGHRQHRQEQTKRKVPPPGRFVSADLTP
jgi:hypothetical protein